VADAEAQSEPICEVQHETGACQEERPGLARLRDGADAQASLYVRAKGRHGKGEAEDSRAEVNISVTEVAFEHRAWRDYYRAEVKAVTALDPQGEPGLSSTGREVNGRCDGQMEPSFKAPDDARVLGLGRPDLKNQNGNRKRCKLRHT